MTESNQQAKLRKTIIIDRSRVPQAGKHSPNVKWLFGDGLLCHTDGAGCVTVDAIPSNMTDSTACVLAIRALYACKKREGVLRSHLRVRLLPTQLQLVTSLMKDSDIGSLQLFREHE
ncbi:hypothetical protein FOZ62_017609, partial [Perkinsus olseni]